jgi:hypothetical protein
MENVFLTVCHAEPETPGVERETSDALSSISPTHQEFVSKETTGRGIGIPLAHCGHFSHQPTRFHNKWDISKASRSDIYVTSLSGSRYVCLRSSKGNYRSIRLATE